MPGGSTIGQLLQTFETSSSRNIARQSKEPSNLQCKSINAFYEQLQIVKIPFTPVNRDTGIPQYIDGCLLRSENAFPNSHVPVTTTPSPAAGIVPTILRFPLAHSLGRVPRWVRILKRIPPRIEEAVVVDNHPRVRHKRVRRDERAQRGVVVAGIVVQQAGPVLLLSRERSVRPQSSRRAALGTVGMVGAAALFDRTGGRQRRAAQMVAVQVVEALPRLTAMRRPPKL